MLQKLDSDPFGRILLLGILLASAVVMAEETLQAEYIGIENCMLCHMPHFESWSETKMSNSFELLKPGVRAEAKQQANLDPNKDFTTDPTCLRCHVTGLGKPGGFKSLDETPDMLGVQCEMCHGPGSIYTEMMMKKQGTYTLEDYQTLGGLSMPSPENNVCTQMCHNTASPFTKSGFVFDFNDRKASGTHRHDLNYIYMPFDLW
ncbi:MAG: cytochrome c family protein [Gammaproteobacteria bacterium]|nr:cytochrome c family protein [Gammaproteobacteria bacterium]